MKVAVFGGRGQVGHALARVAARRGIAVVIFDRQTADITDPHAVEAALDGSFDIAVNAAAYTAVDKAESEPDRAHAVNAEGPRNIGGSADVILIPVIHISTDYVFDGTKSSPYVEEDPIAPLGAYGRSKAAGESALRETGADAVILRTAWVYGLEGANFVKTMLRLATERDVVRVVNDQRGCPTFADDLADGILTIAEQLKASPPETFTGTYHLAATGQATWFDFAQAIFTEAARYGVRSPRPEPITTAEYPTPARRPANSVLDCAKAKRTFAVELPPWNDGLSRMLHAHLTK
jgi:dTDP-4-dehydrorhamnose reductase